MRITNINIAKYIKHPPVDRKKIYQRPFVVNPCLNIGGEVAVSIPKPVKVPVVFKTTPEAALDTSPWRKGRDSNPRRCYPVRFSKAVSSSARPPFHKS